MGKTILIKDKTNLEVVHFLDVSGQSENQINKIISGLSINFNFGKYLIQESEL